MMASSRVPKKVPNSEPVPPPTLAPPMMVEAMMVISVPLPMVGWALLKRAQ